MKSNKIDVYDRKTKKGQRFFLVPRMLMNGVNPAGYSLCHFQCGQVTYVNNKNIAAA